VLGGRLEPGMHVMYCGREQVIEKWLPGDQLQLKDIATNQFSAYTVKKLLGDLFGKCLTMLGYAGEYKRLKERLKKTRVSDITALEDDDPRKKEAVWRQEYVLDLDKVQRGLLKFTPEFLMPIILKVGLRLGDMPAEEFKRLSKSQQEEYKKSGKRVQPSPASVRRWFMIWEESAKDVRALISASASQGNYVRKVSKDKEKCEAVIAIIGEVVDEIYLTKERPSVQDTWDEMEVRIRRENQYRDISDKLPVPHLNTLYKIVAKIDPYERDLARYGKRYADAKHKTNKRGARPTRPLERVEVDETQLPFMVIDPDTSLPIGRPWLVWAIDVYTRMIVGYYLSFVRPSYAEFMQCLLHAIKPKSYVREKYPDLINDWLTYGLMETVFTDNAKIYYSGALREATSELGIKVEYARRYMAWDKPFVERSFRTLALRLLRKFPGTTFSNIFEKADYDPKKHAIVTMEDLQEMIHRWIIDIYSRSPHRGLKDIPARVWEMSVKKFPPLLPPDAQDLEVLLGYIAWRKVGSSIEMFGLLYGCDDLAVVRQQVKGEKAKIKFNPEDISLIWVYDKRSGVYIPVPALDQEYTRGLSLWAHNIIKEQAKRTVEGYVKRDDLCRARDMITAVIVRSVQKLKNIGAKSAQWLTREQHRASFETGTNTSVSSPPEETRADKRNVTLNAGSHPAAGISDFSSDEPPDGESAAQESGAESIVIETSSVQKGVKRNKPGKGQGKPAAEKGNGRKGDGQPKQDGAVEEVGDEFKPTDVERRADLDTTGWGASYDLPR
jgi:putative transposase